MNPHHKQVFEVLSGHFKDREITGAEIGAAEGLLGKALLEHMPNLRMFYGIDPYEYDATKLFERLIPQEIQDIRRTEAAQRYSDYGGRFTHLCMTSDQAASIVPQVDFVWVDGDHINEQVIKDINNYYPKVKVGGIFGGHDWPIVWPILKEDVTLKERIENGVDLTWWLVKE